MAIKIEHWAPEYREAFFNLNRAWIEVDYPLEQVDIDVLSNPESHILSGGGSILSALDGETVVGVVALRPAGDKQYELTKMAVDVPWRGRGIGRLLMEAAIREGEALGADRIILYSNSNTSGLAVELYRKMGFQEIPLEQGVYKRANIKMEKTIQPISIQKTAHSRLSETNFDHLVFGETMSDHMLLSDYRDGAWTQPQIVPFADLSLSPSVMAMHYGQIVWEGMKAFRQASGRPAIFRIDRHAIRLNRSLKRMAMPEMPTEYFDACVRALISLDADWTPASPGAALYIRPLVFASDARFGMRVSDTYRFVIFTGPVPPYYAKPLKVKVEERYIRAARGGTGAAKCAGNYGASLYPTQLAREAGFDQVIWTDGSPELYLEESGTMNVMFLLDGKIVTPPLSDSILDGITRDSILTLAADMGYATEERRISALELVEAHRAGKLQEAFGVGTAAVTAPIELVQVREHALQLAPVTDDSFAVRVKKRLEDIRSGAMADTHRWNTVV
ncbi:MAG: branched-chain amino acid aminotransferase [Saprospiraceae bacterium]